MKAFHWTESEGMIGLEVPGGSFDSFAYEISGDGSTLVGGSLGSNGYEAFRWTESEGMVGLGDLPGGSFGSFANGISWDGSTIVGMGYSSNGYEAFRWTESEGMVGLGDLPGHSFESYAIGISGDGSTIVGRGFGSNGYEAFIWDEANGMLNLQELLTDDFGLDLTGWYLQSAAAISSDGLSIVGTGTNPDGNYEAWLVQLDPPSTVPEPSSTVAILVVAGTGLLATRKCKSKSSKS